jgi:hypothetical protein
MVDISAYAQLDWYEYVWYIDQSGDMTELTRKLVRWISIAENQGAPMMYMVLPKSCRPIGARSSVFPLSQDDWLSAEVQVLKVELDTPSIQEKIGDQRLDMDCFAEFPEVPKVPEDIFLDDKPTSVPVEGEESKQCSVRTVKNRKQDSEGNPVGRSNMNPYWTPESIK